MKYSLLAILLYSATSFSDQNTGSRTIITMGCHNTADGICYMNLSGEPIGPPNCRNNSVRWDSTTAGGKNQFAIMTAAYLSGKPVALNIPDFCFNLQPGYPTFTFSYF